MDDPLTRKERAGITLLAGLFLAAMLGILSTEAGHSAFMVAYTLSALALFDVAVWYLLSYDPATDPRGPGGTGES